MKTLSRLKQNRWFFFLVILLVLLVPIPFLVLGWNYFGPSIGYGIAIFVLVAYGAWFAGANHFLGIIAHLRNLLEKHKDSASGPSVNSIGDGTQILQGAGDNIRASVVIKDSTVTIPPSSFILPTSAPPLPPSSFIPQPSSFSPVHALPAPPGDFTGRTSEIEKLTKELVGSKPVAISGLAGMGGVGKTVLALYVANRFKQQYPDAQILLELKGTSREPLSPTEAMTQVIHTFDATADLRQATPDQIHALYLDVLNDKRALLLFDNAADASQVKSLIPPTSCAMLVTSRRHFVLPGMDTLRLDMLPEVDARKLLLTICPRIGDHADGIAKLCGRLPLALRIAASTLAEHRDLSVDEYAASLADRRTRLAKLKSESDPELDLQATFDYSYDLLADDTKARWRVLAVFPASFDWFAAMSVWALDKDGTRKLLGDLVRFSLLDYDEATERYSLHDLLADFADGRLETKERDAAKLRHSQHYLLIAGAADELYLGGGKNVLLGLKLFDAELQHIRAGQAWAAANMESSKDAARLCSEYPGASGYCLSLRLLASDRIKWLRSALAAARKLGEKQNEGAHLGSIGYAYDDLGETRRAIEYYEQALAIARETGDRREEGIWLGNLGLTFDVLGEMRKAIEYHEQALAIAREFGDRHGEASHLSNLGLAYADLGETRQAIQYHEHALAIAREFGDRHGEASHLSNLGLAYADLGETRKPIEYYEQALAISREIGDRRGESNDLGNLGNAYHALGETRRAIDYYEQALPISRKIGDRRGEGKSLGNLGLAYANLGETRRAIEHYEQALEIARESGDRRADGIILGNLGSAYANLGETRKAIEYYEQSLAIAREISDQGGEGSRLSNLEAAYAVLGETRRAIEYFEQALAIFRQIEDKVNEAKTARLLEDLRKKGAESKGAE